MNLPFAVAQRELEGGITLLTVTGEIDLYTAPELKLALRRVGSDGAPRLIVDLSATTFIDSTGLGVLVAAQKRLRPLGGRLVIVCSDPSLRNVFHLTSLDRTFVLVGSAEAAREHLEHD